MVFKPPDAWRRAVNRFLEDLDEDEKRLYYQASAEEILYDVSALEKTHKDKSKARRFLQKLQPCIDSIEDYGKALDVFANTYPLVMSPLWGSVRILLHLAHESGQYFEKVADMICQIGDSLPRFRDYERLFPEHERLKQALSVIYCDMLNFCSDAKHALRQPKRSMFGSSWKSFERQYGQSIDKFRRHQTAVEKEVDASHMIESSKAANLIQTSQLQVAKDHEESKRWQVFAALSEIDYQGQLARKKHLRHKDTGDWITHETTYMMWKESEASVGLCCCGIPGSGKSVLTSKILEDIRQSMPAYNRNTIYYYCEYDESATLQPKNVYRTMLKQLFASGLLAEQMVSEVVESYTKAKHGPHEQELASLLLRAIDEVDNLYIVVDGLDECDENQQRFICEFLCKVVDLERPVVRVLITCRFEERPLKYFNQFEKLRMSASMNADDIRAFITAEVASRISRQELTLRDPVLEREVVDKLSGKAQGMFLWVYFQILDLCEAASDCQVRQVLDDLPMGLSSTYLRVLQKICKSVNKQMALRALYWAIIARRPLKVAELQEAVAFGKEDKSWNPDKIPNREKLLQACYGLIIRDETQNVHLAHHTVRLFLRPLLKSQSSPELLADAQTGPHETILSEYFVNDMIETLAANTCAAYLCFADFESALVKSTGEKPILINNVFKNGGPLAIPSAIGLTKRGRWLSYRWMGGSHSKMPDIDLAKYMNRDTLNRRPPVNLCKTYALLDYVIEFWPGHTEHMLREIEAREREGLDILDCKTRQPGLLFLHQFWDLILYKSLAFEVRPWGINQHFGPFGCRGCPVPEEGESSTQSLPWMALLHWASEHGHLTLLYALGRELSAHLEHERYHQESLLVACRHGHEAVVGLFLKVYDFDLQDGRAMWEACQAENCEILEDLIVHHCRYMELRVPSEYNGYFWNVFRTEHGVDSLTLLQWCAQRAHSKLATLLVRDHPGHLWDRNRASGRNPLHYAAENGNSKFFGSLLAAVDDVRVQGRYDDIDYNGETPLAIAARLGFTAIVQMLVDVGASPHKLVNREIALPTWFRGAPKDNALRTDVEGPKSLLNAIHLAAINGQTEVLAILPMYKNEDYDRGWMREVESKSQDLYEITSLQLAAAFSRAECVRVLLVRGANVNALLSGFTPLHFAAIEGYFEVAKTLLAYGAEIEETSHEGYNALHYATINERAEVVSLLLREGANPDATQKRPQPHGKRTNQEGEIEFRSDRAIHLAVERNSIEIARMLIESNANLHARCSRKHILDHEVQLRPLDLAVAIPSVGPEMMKLLMQADPTLLAYNPDEESTLEWAARKGFMTGMKALLALGAKDFNDCAKSTTPGHKLPRALRFAIRYQQREAVSSLLACPDLYQPREVVMSLAARYAWQVQQELEFKERPITHPHLERPKNMIVVMLEGAYYSSTKISKPLSYESA